jgi:serine/threonine-protein kinase
MSDDSITVSHDVSGREIQLWGSLEILEEVGRGGFGVVYRAWEPALAREVALKIIRPPDPSPETLASILREGQLLARVRHANVVAVHGAQQIGDEVGLWMEFVRGRSLSNLVRADGPRAAEEAAVIGISLCQALAAVHQAGVLHRDIKAHNVMREAGGRIVLMDFGAGQLLEGPRNQDERAVGTPSYMAPEVLAGGRATARSDIYSLGILLYYLVTGTFPVEGTSWTDFLLAHARFERRPLGDVRPDIPASFVRVVEKATALKPDERYASPGAMLADLTAAATGGLAPRVKRSGKTDSRKRRAPAPPPVSHAWRRVAFVGAPLLLPLALGAITSATFNVTLVRSLEYSQETPLDWWIWGLRALIPGLVQATVVVLLLVLASAVWKIVKRLSPAAAGVGAALRSRVSEFSRRLGLSDAETAAQALLALQILGLAIFCWYFRDIFSASISFIDTAAPSDLEPLRPEHLTYHQLYNFVLAMMILAMSAGARQILRMRRRTPGAPHASMAFVLGVIGVSLVVLAFPYRLIWHSRFERATLNDARCYIIGESTTGRGLLYCPDAAAPRVQEVRLSEQSVQRSGVFESIYTTSGTR